MKYLGLFVLALWLIAQSILSLTNLHFPFEKIILPSVALTAGAILFLHAIKTKLGDIGLLFLSIWLIINSNVSLFDMTFPYIDVTIAILGLGAGFFLIIKR